MLASCAAPRVLRGRDDGRLYAPALRRPGPYLDVHRQLGALGQPRRPRRDLQAPGYHRVGVTLSLN